MLAAFLAAMVAALVTVAALKLAMFLISAPFGGGLIPEELSDFLLNVAASLIMIWFSASSVLLYGDLASLHPLGADAE